MLQILDTGWLPILGGQILGRWDCLLMALGHIFPEELKDSQSRQNKRMKNRKCIRRKGKNIKGKTLSDKGRRQVNVFILGVWANVG